MMEQLYFVGQVTIALLLGALLGWTRERGGKPAGLRTYALVTAGSTLFTIISLHAFGANDSRIAAQIVTGIGFIGAGAILHKDDHVEGITTAAGLWIAAAIGMGVGVGWYTTTSLSTILIAMVLLLNDKKLIKNNNYDIKMTSVKKKPSRTKKI
jgi:putative Mg2+ transporter-C (MgtC) family protein